MESSKNFFENLQRRISSANPFEVVGKIIANKGLAFKVHLENASIGDCVDFHCDNGEKSQGEVVGLDGNYCYVMPYEHVGKVNQNTQVILGSNQNSIVVSNDLIGRVVDYKATPIDSDFFEHKETSKKIGIYKKPTNPLQRESLKENLVTGIRAIDGFLSIGKGQRMAIMAGSGVGKSVLMGMLTKGTKADINVIALIGERGREVVEFIEHELGEEGLKNTIVVVATSDTSALMRTKATYTATTIAEYFCDQGKDVLLMVDSVTRFAMALREIGMSVGEPPGPKGYGPSVFASLPKVLERAGSYKSKGSITGIYTVLVEGGDFDEPISDSVRSITDGHILLSRDLAAKGHYPAIDVLQSISRVMTRVCNKEQIVVSNYLRDLMSSYRETEDLIKMGAYVEGANQKVDKAIHIHDELESFLKQEVDDQQKEDIFSEMVSLARKAESIYNPELLNEE
jgi:flagellum-specific ATP synthase